MIENALRSMDRLFPVLYDTPAAKQTKALSGPGGHLTFLIYVAYVVSSIFQHLFQRNREPIDLPPLSPNATKAELYQRILLRYRGASLLSLNHIPEELHNDPVLKQFVCPINGTPMRDPVPDPTTGNRALFERLALISWLEKFRPNSPFTQRPLSALRMKVLPSALLREVIDHRLKYHQQLIDLYHPQRREI